jgi:two-component system LytT family sensor kinase
MTDTYVMTQTLGFFTGTALNALLLVLVWRTERLRNGRHYGSFAVFLVLLWNLGSLTRYAALLLGLTTVPHLANAVAYGATAFLPAAALLLLSTKPQQRWRNVTCVVIKYASLAIGAALMLSLIAAKLLPLFPVRFETLSQLTAYNFVIHLPFLLIFFRGASQIKHRIRSFTYALFLMMSILGIVLLLSFNLSSSPATKEIIESFTQQATIPITIATFAFLAQFHFADIFVKRGLALLATILVVVTYSTLVVSPVVALTVAHASRPEAAALTVATILWCVPLLVFPLGNRAIARAADRWLLRRPDYKTLSQKVLREIERVFDETQLSAYVAHAIQNALGSAEVRIIAIDETSALSSSSETGHELRFPIRINSMITHLLHVSPGAYSRKLLSDEITFLETLANHVGRKLQALQFEHERNTQQLREARLLQLVTETELKALRAQVNPHFLFNTLNTILDLISDEPKKAEEMTERLAVVFRYLLDRSDLDLVSVSEEFDFLRTYLEIEETRFGERLTVQVSLDPSIADEPVPPLILQPLVENAIKHGLWPKPTGGTLYIGALNDDDKVRLIVRDDGVGWPEHSRRSNAGSPGGIGFKNVVERLQLLYGTQARLAVSRFAGQGTQITITIPKDETQNLNYRRRSVSSFAVAQTA